MRRAWPDGLVDPHVHTSPDVVPRRLDDLDTAAAADAAGYRAIVLKSHHTVTAARAVIAERHTERTRVLGGVVLNLHATGGINPLAVDAALRLGGRVVWMPTVTSANQLRFARTHGIRSGNLARLGSVDGDGVEVLDGRGCLLPEVLEVLDLVASAGAVLATGHLGAEEVMALVPEARRRGVTNVVVTHPEHRIVDLGAERQLELLELGGVWFERVLVLTLPTSEGYPLDDLAEGIRTVGVESTIMATDFGQPDNPDPVVGMRTYIEALLDRGFGSDDIERMACHNAVEAFGLDG